MALAAEQTKQAEVSGAVSAALAVDWVRYVQVAEAMRDHCQDSRCRSSSSPITTTISTTMTPDHHRVHKAAVTAKAEIQLLAEPQVQDLAEAPHPASSAAPASTRNPSKG